MVYVFKGVVKHYIKQLKIQITSGINVHARFILARELKSHVYAKSYAMLMC